MNQSGELAKTSMIYSNVGEVDNQTAVGDLVSTMKAFNIEGSSSLNIVDQMNNLSNKYAVSAAGLGEGLKNSASAMAAQGNSLSQTLALLVGGGEITQDLGGMGNMLKITSMRLAGMKGKLQEVGEEYEDIESVSKTQTSIYNMTKGKVNILDEQNHKLKDTYDILEEVAGAWDDVDSLKKNELAELMFGKNRANQGLAIISAFQSGQIQKAYQDALTSDGSAMAEQTKWMDSIEAKIGSFKAAFQELSSTTVSSDFLKGAIDGGTKFVELLTKIIDKVGLLGTAIGGFAAFKGLKNLG